MSGPTIVLLLSCLARCFASFSRSETPSDIEVCDKSLRYAHAHQPPRQGTPIFTITTNSTKYVTGQTLTVTITSEEKPGFRGFVLQARSYRTNSAVGQFTSPTGSADIHSCDGVDDTVARWYTRETNDMQVTWQPLDDDVDTIHFVAAIFQDDNVYWENVTSSALRKGTRDINLAQCGLTKGCYRYSSSDRSCTIHTCDYVFTYKVVESRAILELSALGDWVAIGFSSDAKMGGDDVLMCARTHSGAEVRHYWNEYQYLEPSLRSSEAIGDQEVDVTEAGRISCRFSRPLKVPHDQFSVDLNNDWYQFYGWGKVSTNGMLIRHEKDRPPISMEKMTLFMKRNIVDASSRIVSLSPFVYALLVALVSCNVVA